MSLSVARNRCGLARREDGPLYEACVSRDLHVHGLCGRAGSRSQLTRVRTTPPSRSLRARPATGREKWGFRVLGLTFWTVGGIASLTLDRLRLTARLPPGISDLQPVVPVCPWTVNRGYCCSALQLKRLSWSTIHLSLAVTAAQQNNCQIDQIGSQATRREGQGTSDRKDGMRQLRFRQRPRAIYIYPLR